MTKFEVMVEQMISGVKIMAVHEEFLQCHSKGCDVVAILKNMFLDQIDHNYGQFSDAYLKYRRVVAEWMIDVSEYFNLHPTTIHAAIAYLDRLQPNEKFSRFEWQMLAVSCILISSKYNECEEQVPSIQKLEEITQQRITNECILNYELWVLKRLGWKLNARTPTAFISTYIEAGVILEGDRCYDQPVELKGSFEKRNELESQAFILSSRCLLDNRLKSYQASAVASAILFFIRRDLGFIPIWREDLTKLTKHDPYSDKQLQLVLLIIEEIMGYTTPRYRGESDVNLANDQSLNDTTNHFSSNVSSAEASIILTDTSTTNSPFIKLATPGNYDKENSKPETESTISPISIAAFK